jgi:hypothetical protein
MKSIKFWVYPTLIIAAWIAVAAFTMLRLSMAATLMREAAPTQNAGSQPSEANPTLHVAAAPGRRPASGG